MGAWGYRRMDKSLQNEPSNICSALWACVIANVRDGSRPVTPGHGSAYQLTMFFNYHAVTLALICKDWCHWASKAVAQSRCRYQAAASSVQGLLLIVSGTEESSSKTRLSETKRGRTQNDGAHLQIS